MPPEPLPYDQKDLLKDRQPSSSDPVGIAPARCRELPTTPSHHNNHGSSSSCRWGGVGGPSDFRRPFSGHHGKRVGGGWRNTMVDSGSKENNNNASGVAMAVGSQKDRTGGNSWETIASPNGNSHPHYDFVNSSDQLQPNDPHAKNNSGGVGTTNSQRLEKENLLGSSLDWKPLKWVRSGSLSSRGSGFSNSSNCKIIGVDSLDTKLEAQLGNNTPLRSPSGDPAPCVTPRTPDEASSCKKARLGWGEGLAKYEKKKVDPDTIVDKEAGVRNGMVDGVSSSEPLLPSPSNLSDKSPSLTGFSECASPTTPYSFACSSSPGVEEKESVKEVKVVNDVCNPSVVSCHLSENHTEGLAFNLENLEVSQGFNLSSSLDELLQTGDSNSPGSGFVRSTAMDKLQVWKADISRTLEITETEIDSLENELKLLISSCSFPDASSSSPTQCNNKISEDHTGVEDSDGKSPGMSTSEPVEQRDSAVNFDKCSEDVVSDDMLGVVSSCRDNTVSVGGVVQCAREDKLYDSLLITNKVIANTASDELSRILPTTNLCTNISKATNESLVKKRIAARKRFLKFKERAITLKFRALQFSWKEDLNLLSVRRTGSKSHKKFESSSRMGYVDHQKYRSSRSCSGGSLSTTYTLDYVNKLLSDSRVRVHRNALKMPSLSLDRRERMGTRFISYNGLVEDPVDVEKERFVVNPWTEKEKEIFLDKYSLFGKDFKKIASFLEHKTIADCVEFYYKNHKSDCFQNAKKNSEFAKGKSCTTNTYLVTSGRRLNREAGATSLEMLGAASVMVANVRRQQKFRPNYHVGVSSDKKLQPGGDVSILERSNDLAMFCNEQETAAADVLAGICGSISSEALGSCITSSGDVHVHHHGKKFDGSSKMQRLTADVDEETCSDESCGEEVDACAWTDEEKARFIKGVRSYGKDFSMISQFVRTRSIDQCRVYFSKARKCLGLDAINVVAGSEVGNQDDEGGGTDPEDACMVDNVSAIVHDNKHEVEEMVGERSSNDAGSEAANLEEAPQSTYSEGSAGETNDHSSASGAKAEDNMIPSTAAKVSEVGITKSEHELNGVRDSRSCPVEDLNYGSEKVASQKSGDGFLMSNLFPTVRKAVSQDNASPRLSFRKSCDKMYQRSSSTDLPKSSFLDCVESSQILKGYPLTRSTGSETQSNFKLDKSLFMPRDLISVSEEQKQSSSSSSSGDVKLFGQILTKPPESGGRSFNLKFDDRKPASVDIDHSLTVKKNLSYGFWDGNRIQTGFSCLPDSARLLAKYPAAFSNMTTSFKFDSQLHSESQQQVQVVSCNGVSDPVAALRMHYAKTEDYKNGGREGGR